MLKEFDYDLKADRYSCASAWISNPNKDKDIFQECNNVLDFFETLGHLVRNKRIDAHLAYHSFSYGFTGYYMGMRELIESERKKNPEFYQDVVWLYSLWGEDPSLKNDSELKEFFHSEMRMCGKGRGR